MGVARYLVHNHSKIAAKIVLPLSVAGGFLYTMKTGESPFTSRAQGEEGTAQVVLSAR